MNVKDKTQPCGAITRRDAQEVSVRENTVQPEIVEQGGNEQSEAGVQENTI